MKIINIENNEILIRKCERKWRNEEMKESENNRNVNIK